MNMRLIHGMFEVSAEQVKHELDLMGVYKIRWERSGTKNADEFTFFYGKGNENHELGTSCFDYKGTISAVKRIEVISDRMSYITPRGH
jgi:hypothetical protein